MNRLTQLIAFKSVIEIFQAYGKDKLATMAHCI